MKRAIYPTDLTDAEWNILEPLVPLPKPGGCPAKYQRREIINAIRYVLPTGCSWRLLPHDLPPWQLVYHYFWVWRREETWQRIHSSLHIRVRQTAGMEATPSGAIVDSQSVKTTEKRGLGVTTPARK